MNLIGIKKKTTAFKSVEAFGYDQDLICLAIPDPITYYTNYVAEKNQKRSSALADETRPCTFSKPVEYYLGHFLIHGLLEKMNVKEKIDIVSN